MKPYLLILLFFPGLIQAQFADSARCGRTDIRDTFVSSHKRYHRYEVRHLLGTLTDHPAWTADYVFRQILADKQCVAPVTSSVPGPLVPCQPTDVIIAITRKNPVVTSVDTAFSRLVNYSLPGHFLHPGKVERKVVVTADSVWVVTTSVGYGRMPKIDERKAESVWRKVDDYLLGLLLARKED